MIAPTTSKGVIRATSQSRQVRRKQFDHSHQKSVDFLAVLICFFSFVIAVELMRVFNGPHSDAPAKPRLFLRQRDRLAWPLSWQPPSWHLAEAVQMGGLSPSHALQQEAKRIGKRQTHARQHRSRLSF